MELTFGIAAPEVLLQPDAGHAGYPLDESDDSPTRATGLRAGVQGKDTELND